MTSRGVGEGLALMMIGLAFGLAAVAGRFVTSLLYEVSPAYDEDRTDANPAQ